MTLFSKKHLIISGFALFLPFAVAAGVYGVTITTVDNTGVVALYTDIQVASDGSPVISHYDNTNGDLKITKCGNAACSAGNTSTAVDTGGVVGLYTSLALDENDLPVISYQDNTNTALKVAKCSNSGCTAGTTLTTVDNTASVGEYTSLALGNDGFPVISYYDSTNGDLKVAKCSNSGCTTGTTLSTIDSGVGNYTSIAIGSDGFPIISYYDHSSGDLKVAKCSNSGCTTGTTLTTVDAPFTVGVYTSITIDENGLPVISYHDVTNSSLKVAKCSNSGCTTGTTLTTVDNTANVGQFTSLALGSDGFPVISYYDITNTALKVAKCSNSGCTTGTTLTTVDNGGYDGMHNSLAIGNDGYPVIAYANQTLYDLKVAKCADATCEADTATATPALTSPASSASVTPSVLITYSLPEAPLNDSVTLTFSGSTGVTLTMTEDMSVSFTLDTTDILASTGVTASTAASIPEGLYTVTLSYQDASGNAAATSISTNVTIATPVVSSVSSSSISSSSSSISNSGGGGGRRGGPGRGIIAPTLSELKQSSSMQTSSVVARSSVSSVRNEQMNAVKNGIIMKFNDVTTDDWFAPYVEQLVQRNIVEGYKDAAGTPLGQYGPADPITLGQLAKVSTLIAEKNISLQNDEDWTLPYLQAAQEMQLTVFTDSIDISVTATRAEVLQSVLEALDITITAGSLPYSDVTADHQYANAIATATELGIISGDDNAETFRPDEPVNRAEVAKIIALAWKVVGK